MFQFDRFMISLSISMGDPLLLLLLSNVRWQRINEKQRKKNSKKKEEKLTIFTYDLTGTTLLNGDQVWNGI